VWLGDSKVAAIGVRAQRWVTYHGMAVNIDMDLAPFGMIVPCGISGVKATGADGDGMTAFCHHNRLIVISRKCSSATAVLAVQTGE